MKKDIRKIEGPIIVDWDLTCVYLLRVMASCLCNKFLWNNDPNFF